MSTAGPIITIDPARSSEGNYVTFTVRLSEPATDAVTVNYAAMPKTAGWEDLVNYSSSPLAGSVTFAVGDMVQTISIYARSESNDELDEAFTLELRDPVNATLGDNIHSLSTLGWVQDNDGPGNNRAMAVSNPVITEMADGKAVFTVSLSQAFPTTTSFTFRTVDGDAKAGTDYVARTGTVTFFPGQTEAQVEIDLLDNAMPEAGEQFGLAITAGNGVDAAFGSARLLDDDATLPVVSVEGSVALEADYTYFTLRLSEPATDAVTVDYAVMPQSAGLDDLVNYSSSPLWGSVTFELGQTVRRVPIYVRGEGEDELDQAFSLELSDPVNAAFGTNIRSLSALSWALDNDGPGNNRALSVSDPVVSEAGGSKAIFTVALSQAVSSVQTFSFRTVDGDAKAGSDYVARTGTVTFLPGQTEAVVEIDLINNGAVEATESFTLQVDKAGGVNGATGTGLILDDDGTVPILSVESGMAQEGDYVYFTVRLSKPAGDAVTVDYAAMPKSATLEDLVNYSSSPLTGTVTFAAGETVKRIPIYIRSEGNDELDEAFALELRNPSGAGFGGGNSVLQALGWALDNDGPTLNRTVAVSDPIVTEGSDGRVATFSVEISTPHTESISLAYSTVAGSATAGQDFRAQAGTITFAAGQTRALVTVPILSNLMPESPETFLLRIQPPFPAAISSQTLTATGTATIQDGTRRGTNIGETLIGTNLADAIDGQGGNDRIFGRMGNDWLMGGAGNDLLNGGAGADRMIGGIGNDLYQVDRNDVIVEARAQGVDTVQAWFSYTLGANLEKLVLAGTAAINGTGNAGANVLIGNAARNGLAGGAGNDVLRGGGGNDILNGGLGNDVLNGGAGADRMIGGIGNDLYQVDRNDVIVEARGQGIDTVQAWFSYTLGANLEKLVLAGTAAINGTGNAGANVLIGNAARNGLAGGAGNDVLRGGGGNDILNGGLGNDTLNGGAGADRMIGGVGNDRYIGTAGDVIVEAAGRGIDTVQSAGTWALGPNLEILQLLGAAHAGGNGNGLANVLMGNAGNNLLRGFAGNDRVNGGGGNDILNGGLGNDVLNGGIGADRLIGEIGRDLLYGGIDAQRDVFVFRRTADSTVGAGRDQIFNFVSGRDDIDLSNLDAHIGRAGNQAFSFSATAASHSVWTVAGQGGVSVRVDDDGDRIADMEIWLAGVTRLGGGDFLL